jgi:hypothetical protein
MEFQAENKIDDISTSESGSSKTIQTLEDIEEVLMLLYCLISCVY